MRRVSARCVRSDIRDEQLDWLVAQAGVVLLFIKYVSDKYADQPYAPITVPTVSIVRIGVRSCKCSMARTRPARSNFFGWRDERFRSHWPVNGNLFEFRFQALKFVRDAISQSW